MKFNGVNSTCAAQAWSLADGRLLVTMDSLCYSPNHEVLREKAIMNVRRRDAGSRSRISTVLSSAITSEVLCGEVGLRGAASS